MADVRPLRALHYDPARIDDLASDGRHVYAAAGATLWRLDADTPVELRRFDAAISALAVSAHVTRL